MLYIIQTKDKPNQLEIRAKLESKHRAYLDDNEKIFRSIPQKLKAKG